MATKVKGPREVFVLVSPDGIHVMRERLSEAKDAQASYETIVRYIRADLFKPAKTAKRANGHCDRDTGRWNCHEENCACPCDGCRKAVTADLAQPAKTTAKKKGGG